MTSATLSVSPRRVEVPGSAWVLPPLVVLGALFLYPLSLIAGEALNGATGLSIDNFVRVVSTAAFRHALLNTIEISLSASAGCIVLGFVLALILSFVPFPGSRIVARLIETYIAVPTFLVALAFTFLYGSAGVLNETLMQIFRLPLPPVDFLYSPWGVILAEVTVYTPFAMRPLLAAFSTIDPAQIEVATSLGGRARRIVMTIILPAAIPALLAGGSLCLLLTLNEFGIVLFIGAKGVITLPLLIYDKAIQEFDYTTACVVAVVNVVLSLLLYSLYRVVLVRFSGGGGAGLV